MNAQDYFDLMSELYSYLQGVIARSFPQTRHRPSDWVKRRLHALDAKVDADPMDEKNVADLIRIAEDKTSPLPQNSKSNSDHKTGLDRRDSDWTRVVTFLAKTTNDRIEPIAASLL